MKTIEDAMARIDPILQAGWWMRLESPWTADFSWRCGLTPKLTTGWNGRPDIEASGETASEAIEACCDKWEREQPTKATGQKERNNRNGMSGWVVTLYSMLLGFLIFPPFGLIVGLVAGCVFYVIRGIVERKE